jgi:lipoprotein LpqH
VNKGLCTVAATALMISGCSDKAATPAPGVLPPGTAMLSIDGNDLGKTYSVRCQSIDWMTKIDTDLHASNVSAMLSNADTLKAEFIRFDDVDGFTGSYQHALQGEAKVTMIGRTYHITGAALGFNDAQPTRLKAETFAIKVSC